MYNEALPMPARPDHVDLDEGVVRGGYLLEPAAGTDRVSIFLAPARFCLKSCRPRRPSGMRAIRSPYTASPATWNWPAMLSERSRRMLLIPRLDTIFPETDVPTVAATDYVVPCLA